MTELELQSVRDQIADGGVLSRPYVVMNMLAAAVASYGLLANSQAVVIGAMIIALLLGPITAMDLAHVDELHRRSAPNRRRAAWLAAF